MTIREIRRRRRSEPPVADEPLPPETLAYVRENFMPPVGDDALEGPAALPVDDHRAMLLFMEAHFSERAYRQHRHTVMDQLLRANRSVPEIAVMFDKSERTIWRWKEEMTDYISEMFSLQDVRDIYVNRMADYAYMMKKCDTFIEKPGTNADQVAAMIRTKVRVHAMMDQVLRGAGYNRAFTLQQLAPQDQASARDTEGFLNDLDTALLDEVPLLEHEEGN